MSKQLILSSILAVVAMGGFVVIAQADQPANAAQVAATAPAAEAGFGS